MSSGFSQVAALREESEALYALIASRGDAALAKVTRFKNWTIEDVIAHLHIFNWAADASFADAKARAAGEEGADQFPVFYQALTEAMGSGKSMIEATEDWLDEHEGGVRGRALLERWRAFFGEFCDRAESVDPKLRVQWAGPEMSARSSITARLMETWAHGQEVYDALGVERVDEDRIKNIAVLGINTYGWTFINRKLEPPEPTPWVRLIAPSGAVWEWGEEQHDNRVEGSATEFCQVVTQTRNFADTKLVAVGSPATAWMSIAQCFAGRPEDPPAPGTRRPD